MLRQRLFWGSLLIGLITLLFWWDYSTTRPVGFTLLMMTVAGAGLYEFYKMYENIGIILPKIFPIIIAVSWFFINLVLSSILSAGRDFLPFDIIFLVFLTGAVAYYLFNKDVTKINHLFILVAGFVYICLPLYYIYLIRYDRGLFFLIYFIALNKLADTFAYFGGRLFGRHRLAPQISPNKTVEGLISALILGSFSGLFLWSLLPVSPEIGQGQWWVYLAIINFAIILAGQSGDLLESMFKRYCQVKDSSRLVPGLGGVLDLIDCLLLSAPVAYYLSIFLRMK
ncbi:MAG: phosphatidate cytidylyltransferase [Planctomycetota bacterium]